MTATLQIKNLTKDFGKIKAVDNCSFSAKNGEIIALLGPNGAGKSTLMNMISGYLAPSGGEIFILNKNIQNNSLFAKQNIGYLPEGAPAYPDLSVRDFLGYMAELRGFRGKEKQQIIAEIAKTAKIENILSQKNETLSKGYQRRVGFAQSIISDPPILLLDEPTDGLDPNQKQHIRALIFAMKKNKTILISTHLLDEAESLCDRIILINRGKIMADGNLAHILKQAKAASLEEAFHNLTLGAQDNE
ncbi:MAG: ABC transporter ATP-binding protein [Alphaproteobacteria bacterium]|nr:ABC transporter ATP-binding protein [Alphaproteobacteria bacterium]